MKIVIKDAEVDVKYPKKLYDLYSDLPFLPRRMKIDKCKKLILKIDIKITTKIYK